MNLRRRTKVVTGVVAAAIVLSLGLHVILIIPGLGRAMVGKRLLVSFADKCEECEEPQWKVTEVELDEPAPKKPKLAAVQPDPVKKVEPLPKARQKKVEPKAEKKTKKQLRKKLVLPKPKPKPKKKPKKKPPKKKPEKPKPIKIKKLPKLLRKKMVDQDWKKREPPPKDAPYLADTNRDVKVMTRAKRTNLDKHSNKTQLAMAEKKPRIASLTRQKKDTVREPHRAVNEKAGNPRQAERPKTKPKPRVERKQKPKRPQPKNTILAMRNRKPNQDRKLLEPTKLPLALGGDYASERRSKPSPKSRASRLRRKLTLQDLKPRLTPQEADKIYGKQWRAEIRQRNKRRGSSSTKSKRWAKIKAALENFVPEVKEGNQTALRTRAHPFAKYIAKMHRKIHRGWGFGFLVDLDRLPSTDQFNSYQLWTKLEIVINGQTGEVKRIGIAKPSGYLPFDVAAMDVVLAKGPYGPPPKAILSANGNVYMHWNFHRDHRQCGTFGVNPFILTVPPKGPSDKSAGPVSKGGRRVSLSLSQKLANAVKGVVNHKAAQEAARRFAKAMDPGAKVVALKWLTSFQRGDGKGMVAASYAPFTASGRTVAKGEPALLKIFAMMIAESPVRRILGQVTLHTAAGLRSRMRTLPRGIRPGQARLYAVARVGRTDVVLVLGLDAVKRWRVMGIAR